MPCNAAALATATISAEFYARLAMLPSVQRRVREAIAEIPGSAPEKLITPDHKADPPRHEYSYYHRGVYVTIDRSGKVSVRASSMGKAKMTEIARRIKEAVEDEMAAAMGRFGAKAIRLAGVDVVSEGPLPGGGYSVIIDL